MREYLKELVRGATNPQHAKNLAREYLQQRMLECIQRVGGMIHLAFHGGTALRILYLIPRYSEDLDFSLERERDRFDFRALVKNVVSELQAEGYDLDCKISDRRAVNGGFFRFAGILYDLGISPRREQVLSVKIEIDTNPPQGVGLSTTLVRRHVTLRIQHHDQASMLAGKLHAILQRAHTKGRDLFDLFWYLSNPDWPAPNLKLLNNALAQTGWRGEALTEGNWSRVVEKRLGHMDFKRAMEDLRPFLEKGTSADLLTRENLSRLLLET
jgi:hypothetical protein